MKRLIIPLSALLVFSAFADPVTLDTLTVDTTQRSICGVSLGMTKSEVKTELGKRKLNFAMGQKADHKTKTMIPDEDFYAVNSSRDRIMYAIIFRGGKVWLQEILFAGYGERTASAFAAKLWQASEGTAIDVAGRTVQIYKN